ncbi:MAG: hypothetical protein AB7O78_03470 [Thermoleophilia bacterium]
MGRPPGIRAGRAAGVVLAAAAAIAMAPASAAAWEAPVTLSPGTPADEGPLLAVDAAGDAVVAWGRGAPTTEDEGPPRAWRVEASTRPPGAPAWSAPQRLSPAGELGFDVAVAMLPTGVPVVTWTTMRRGIADVTRGEARGEPSGWVTTPLDIVSGAWSQRATAAGPDGTLAVATTSPWWIRGSWLRLQVREPGGTWREPPLLPVRLEHLAVAALPGGRVVVAWLEQQGEQGSPDARTLVVTREWDPTSGWRDPERGDDLAGAAHDFRLAATADGSLLAVVVLRHERGSDVVAAARSPGGAWAAPQVLAGSDAGNVRLTVSPDGSAAAAWDDAGDTRVSTWRPGRGWSPVETPPPGACVRPRQLESIAMGPSGELLVVGSAGWMSDFHHGYIRAWTRGADGPWVGPVWLSRPVAGNAVAAIDGSGRMHVAWSRASAAGVVRTQVTSTDPAGAGTGVVRGDPVAAVTRLTVSGRGATSLAVRFRLSQPGRVVVQLQRAAPAYGLGRRITAIGRRGANSVLVRLGGTDPVRPGRYVVVVWSEAGVVSGCAVHSRALVIR